MGDQTLFPQYSGRIMYPPRPKLSIPPSKIDDYEKKGYVAQLKFNGTRTLVEIKKDSEISLWTRNKVPHKGYSLGEGLKNDLVQLHKNGDSSKSIILDGELMHNKTKGLKDIFIVFDLLVCDDDYLVGMSMLERYIVLDDIMGGETWEDVTGRKIAIKCSEHIWMAETFMHNLSSVYSSRIDMDEIEGIVLKNPKAPLDRGLSENNNSDWLIRCRKPHKNYEF